MASRPPRVLRFNSRHALGALAMRQGRDAPWVLRGPALGSVAIAAGAEVRLDVSKAGATELAVLQTLESDALQGINFAWSEVTDAQLGCLAGLTGLEGVDLGDTGPELCPGSITDRGLEQLAPLSALRGLAVRKSHVRGASLGNLTCDRLTWLDISETPAGDDAAMTLRSFRLLKALNLRRSTITDRAAEPIAGLPNLHRLDVSDNSIGDAFVDALAGAPAIDWLDLGGTRITDRGLARLSQLRGLRKLDIWQCDVSDVAIDALQRALPDCAIAF